MYGVPDPDSLSDALDVGGLTEIRLLCELLGGSRVTFRDKVVHDDPVDVAFELISIRFVLGKTKVLLQALYSRLDASPYKDETGGEVEHHIGGFWLCSDIQVMFSSPH